MEVKARWPAKVTANQDTWGQHVSMREYSERHLKERNGISIGRGIQVAESCTLKGNEM